MIADPAALEERLARELRAAPVRGRFVVARVHAPSALGLRFLALASNRSGPLEAPHRRVAFTSGDRTGELPAPPSHGLACGFGSAFEVRTNGAERFRAARGAALEFTRELAASGPLSAEETRAIRFFGGAAFTAGRPATDAADEFGDAFFFVPEVLYADDPEGASLTIVTRPERVETVLERLGSYLHAIGRGASERATALPETPRILGQEESLDAAAFGALVERIRAEIRRGSFDKVVLARRSTLDLSAAPEPNRLLERLGVLAPRCARFLLGLGDRTFLGAPPERLVRKFDDRVETEALAGSISAALPGAGERLLASAKDRSEHAFVVEALRDALVPLCSDLEIPETPSLRPLRSILHLRTPLVGRLTETRHVLDLVEHLHPTPAVGGSPRAPALAFLEEHERAPRGWYAAPFGHFDLAGDGEFVVALRSALVVDRRVHVYAGAGIVEGSDPREEFQETELKMGNMLSALGLAMDSILARETGT